MKKPVELTLTEWVRSGEPPTSLMFGNDVTLKEQNDDINREDFAQRFDADFVLYTGELMTLMNTMITDLGGEAECESNGGEDNEEAGDTSFDDAALQHWLSGEEIIESRARGARRSIPP